MATLATNQASDITLDIKLDTPIELGVDINMAVVTIKEKLSVLVSTHSLHGALAAKMPFPDWFEWQVVQGNLRPMEDCLVNPEGHGFFSYAGS